MIEHEIKTWSEFFDDIESGRKPFEIRRDDRGYRVGHRVRHREWDRFEKRYTGRECVKVITYIVRDVPHFGLMPGYCVFGQDRTHEQAVADAPLVRPCNWFRPMSNLLDGHNRSILDVYVCVCGFRKEEHAA